MAGWTCSSTPDCKQTPTRRQAFEAAIFRLPAVFEAVHVTGTWDYQLRVRVPDAARIDVLIRTLKRDAGVEQTQTRLVLRTALAPRRR